MKKITITLLLLIVAFFAKAQAPAADKGIAMLKAFYTAYISASAEDVEPGIVESKLSVLRKKYCTMACLKQFKLLVKQTDADPIIKAQDSYQGLLPTLVIKKDPRKLNGYAITYTDIEGSHEKTNIYVTLIQQNGVLKIASLK